MESALPLTRPHDLALNLEGCPLCQMDISARRVNWNCGVNGNTGNPSPSPPPSTAIRSIPELLERMTFT